MFYIQILFKLIFLPVWNFISTDALLIRFSPSIYSITVAFVYYFFDFVLFH
jgi:hypothetical protein